MSLRLRVVVAIALLFLTGSAVGVALAGVKAEAVLREELVAALDGGRLTLAGAFATLPTDGGQRTAALVRLARSFDGARHVRATLFDAHRRVVTVSQPLPARPAPAAFEALFRPEIGPLVMVAPGGDVLVLAPLAADDVAAIWAEFGDLVAVLAVSFVVGAGLVWLTVGRALEPLAAFSAALGRVGAGDYAARVAETGPPELARLGGAVNDMAARLAAMQARTHRLEEQIATLQDEERADLARDLHDEIGPHLFAVGVDAAMASRLIAEGGDAEAELRLSAIRLSVTHMQRLVRDILGRLRPAELIDLGLAAAVAELIAFWRARRPAVAFEAVIAEDETAELDEATRAILYRVVQEGLSNAMRHGRPARVSVRVGCGDDGAVFASVADDGAGGEGAAGQGFGLVGMRERVEGAGGVLSIDREGGWTVTAHLPARASPVEVAT